MKTMLPLNEIILGDCVATMRSFPNDCIDLTVTSPPYDDLMDYKGYSFDDKATIQELFRITKTSGVVVWVIGDATIKGTETGSSFKQALYFKEVGFNLHDTMIWVKSNPMPSFIAPRYNQSFEYMFVFSKDIPKTFNPITEPCKTAGQTYTSVKNMSNRSNPTRKILKEPKKKKDFKNLSNVWTMGHAARSYGHPAVFPEKLAEYHILTWSNKGGLVFDPFMGSGTTAVMALKNGRKFIGCEISEEYKKSADERIVGFLKGEMLTVKDGKVEHINPFVDVAPV